MNIKWLIVGAGFTGATIAEQIVTCRREKVLLIDQREHIGGNAYDEYDEYGTLVHRYGPHIFHTNAQSIWRYLSQFTRWKNYFHQVLGMVDGQPVPIPFNLNTLAALFPHAQAERISALLIEQYGYGQKVPILKLRQSSSAELIYLSDFIYEKIFKHYTAKQWELTPEELGPSVTARVPVVISRDNRYFQDIYQGMPAQGYTALFRNMLKHNRLHIMLNTRFQDIVDEIHAERIIFTGPIDEYFTFCHGALPYRSLAFTFYHDTRDTVQAAGTINYPNEYDFTRTTEFKWLTGQICQGSTWIEEYPQVYRAGENDPYYPIPKDEYRTLYKKYQDEAEKLRGKVWFAGRLGDYQYYNMDQAVARALHLFEKELNH